MFPSSIIFILFIGIVHASNPTATLQNGDLRGTWKISAKGRTFASFQGIPYAKPPIGELRFQDAVVRHQYKVTSYGLERSASITFRHVTRGFSERPPERFPSWSAEWNATAPGAKCLQYDPFDKAIYGSEDCLFLNVYTPRLEPGVSLPVIVYIHGGAFMYGTGAIYGPALLMDFDVVMVTINYRVGPLGFLSTGDEIAPGNVGLKDQAFALRWIKENIRSFGGNPDSITLLGQSAGGASVHYHYISPLSQDFFARGLAISGSAFAPWAFSTRPVQKAKILGSLLGCPTNSSAAMVNCLMKKPGDDLMNAQAKMISWKVKLFTVFTPTVEPVETKGAFLTEHPYLATKSSMKQAPLVTSVTSEEGLYPTAAYQKYPDLLPDLADNWEELCSSIFEYNDTLPLSQRAAAAAKIKEYYLKNKTVSQDTFANLTKAHSDRLFIVPVAKLAQMHSASGQPTYVYYYRFRGEKSLANLLSNNEENYGICHADDLIHILDLDMLSGTTLDDLRMNDIMTSMVSSFAITGIPNVGDKIEWRQVTPAAFNYLEISSPEKIRMETDKDFGHQSFWDNIGFAESEKYDLSGTATF